MANTLITFNGKYWEYGGDFDVYDKGLTIGAYESAWFADLVAAYIFERTQVLFDELKYVKAEPADSFHGNHTMMDDVISDRRDNFREQTV